MHLPLEDLRDRINEVPNDKFVVVYCKTGQRGYFAERILRQHGFKDIGNLSGGFQTWKQFHPAPPSDSDGVKPTVSASPVANPAQAERASSRNATAGDESAETETLDARGLQCPGPIMAVAERITSVPTGSRLRVLASDPGFSKDIAAWCRSQGHTLLDTGPGPENGHFVALIQSGPSGDAAADTGAAGGSDRTPGKGQTIVVFSGDMDRVLAAFVIANGAAAMGHPVTMFFTFWGLNVLRRGSHVTVKKSLLDRAFGWMMPRGANRLKLSRMNMGGLGSAIMKHVMSEKGVASLPQLMADAQKQGVRMVACTMSMDVMGIQPEELIDGLDYAGVGAYIGDAESSRMNLFI